MIEANFELDTALIDDESVDSTETLEPTTPEKPATTIPISTKAAPVAQKARRISREPLYFDIETVPDTSRMELFGLEPLPEPMPERSVEDCMDASQLLTSSLTEIKKHLELMTPCEEYLVLLAGLELSASKPRKGVQDAIESFRNSRKAIGEAEEKRNKLLSVTPEYCRIVAFGWAYGDEPPKSYIVDASTEEEQTAKERMLLDHWWSLASATRGPVVGYNIQAFDLPVLFTRSALLSSIPTRQFDLRSWSADILDIYKKRFPSIKNPNQPGKLKDLARLYGIDIPAGETDGSQVLALLESDPAKLREYVKSDISVTRELHKKFRGFFC